MIVAKKNVDGPVAARAVRHRERRVVDEDRERRRPRHAKEENAVQPDSVPLELVDVTACGDIDVACAHRPASCSSATQHLPSGLPSPSRAIVTSCAARCPVPALGTLHRLTPLELRCAECRHLLARSHALGTPHAALSSDCVTTTTTPRSTFRRLLGFAAAHRRLLVLSIVLALAAQAFALAIPSLTGRAIDDAIRPHDREPAVALGLADRRRGR